MSLYFEYSYYFQYDQSVKTLCFLEYILVNYYILIRMMGNPTKAIG